MANASGQPGLWWDYVAMFASKCTMKDHQYGVECARKVIILPLGVLTQNNPLVALPNIGCESLPPCYYNL